MDVGADGGRSRTSRRFVLSLAWRITAKTNAALRSFATSPNSSSSNSGNASAIRRRARLTSPCLTPVVVHRVFGTRLVERRVRAPEPGGSFGDRDFTIPGRDLTTATLTTPQVDERYGARLSPQEAAALFAPDPSLDFTRGRTVNAIWDGSGIAFRLLAVVDQMAPSHIAARLPEDNRVFDRHAYATRVHRPGALNLFVVGAFEGGNGIAGPFNPGVPREEVAYAYVSDLDGLIPIDGPAPRWELLVTLVAHEFGHVLGLPHDGEWTNVMHMAADRGDIGMWPTQWRIARLRAEQLRWPVLRGDPPHIGVDEPRPWDDDPRRLF